MSKTKIEWTEATWNPVSGCDKISDGCKNCYAEKMAKRLQAMGAKGYENGFAVTLHPERLNEPTKRKKPTMYFVCSMGDLFHDDIPFEFIDKIFDIMFACPQHTFQILTKRPERMRDYIKERAYRKQPARVEEDRIPFKYMGMLHLDDLYYRNMCGYAKNDFACDCSYLCSYPNNSESQEDCEHGHRKCFSFNCPISTDNPHKSVLEKEGVEDEYEYDDEGYAVDCEWMEIYQRPKYAYVSNVWLGVTAENQEQADKRIPILLDTPAHKRFVSIEPMIGNINLKNIINDYAGIRTQINSLIGHKSIGNADFLNTRDCQKLDWVICGGETGANARPMHPNWVRSLRDQCQDAKVPFFFKQWGEWAFEMPTSFKKEPTLYMNTYGHTATEEEAIADGGSWKGFWKVGKKIAGHLIDGEEYREMIGNTQ